MELTGRVSAVRISGLRRVEEAALLAAIDLAPGDFIAGWKVRRDLVAIYGTGFVEDVRVDVSPDPAGEGEGAQAPVIVTFEVDEKPAIREVLVSGNKKLDEDLVQETQEKMNWTKNGKVILDA